MPQELSRCASSLFLYSYILLLLFCEVPDRVGLWLGCCSARQYEEVEFEDPSAPQKKVDTFNEVLRSFVDWLISQVEPLVLYVSLSPVKLWPLYFEILFLSRYLHCFGMRNVLSTCVQLRSPSHPTRGIPTAVSSLAALLRIPKVRAMFIRADGTKLLTPLITPASNQQYIQVILIHIVLHVFLVASLLILLKSF